MKLIITQPELEEIVRAHVLSTVQLRDGSNFKIDFTATRGDDGIVTTIDIPYMGLSGIASIAAAKQIEAAQAQIQKTEVATSVQPAVIPSLTTPQTRTRKAAAPVVAPTPAKPDPLPSEEGFDEGEATDVASTADVPFPIDAEAAEAADAVAEATSVAEVAAVEAAPRKSLFAPQQ